MLLLHYRHWQQQCWRSCSNSGNINRYKTLSGMEARFSGGIRKTPSVLYLLALAGWPSYFVIIVFFFFFCYRCFLRYFYHYYTYVALAKIECTVHTIAAAIEANKWMQNRCKSLWVQPERWAGGRGRGMTKYRQWRVTVEGILVYHPLFAARMEKWENWALGFQWCCFQFNKPRCLVVYYAKVTEIFLLNKGHWVGREPLWR